MALQEIYLETVKRCLLGNIYQQLDGRLWRGRWWQRAWAGLVQPRGARILLPAAPHDEAAREEGGDWPAQAYTMVGALRLDNVRQCIETVLRNDIAGDFIEAGVWRGGTTIWMRAVLVAHGDTQRKVWVADSFAGLPQPNAAAYPADAGDGHFRMKELAISLQEVQDNFARFSLLDERVKFLKGWFRDTLPAAPIEKLALIRLDGDMYESTMDGLVHLYDKLSVGGFIIIDDYSNLPACARAVDEFRAARGIVDKIEPIDWTGVYWCKS